MPVCKWPIPDAFPRHSWTCAIQQCRTWQAPATSAMSLPAVATTRSRQLIGPHHCIMMECQKSGWKLLYRLLRSLNATESIICLRSDPTRCTQLLASSALITNHPLRPADDVGFSLSQSQLSPLPFFSPVRVLSSHLKGQRTCLPDQKQPSQQQEYI